MIHSCVQQEVIQIIREEGKKRKIILMWRAVVPVSLPTTHLPLGQFKPPSNLRFLFLNVDSRRETMYPSFTQYLELIYELRSAYKITAPPLPLVRVTPLGDVH